MRVQQVELEGYATPSFYLLSAFFFSPFILSSSPTEDDDFLITKAVRVAAPNLVIVDLIGNLAKKVEGPRV